jgi:hypothetical protein
MPNVRKGTALRIKTNVRMKKYALEYHSICFESHRRRPFGIIHSSKFGLNPVSVLYLSPANAAISNNDENKIPFSTQQAVTQDVLLHVYVLKNREGCFCLSRQRKGLSG